MYTVFLRPSSAVRCISGSKNLVKTLVKNLAKNLVENLTKNLVKNLIKIWASRPCIKNPGSVQYYAASRKNLEHHTKTPQTSKTFSLSLSLSLIHSF